MENKRDRYWHSYKYGYRYIYKYMLDRKVFSFFNTWWPEQSLLHVSKTSKKLGITQMAFSDGQCYNIVNSI